MTSPAVAELLIKSGMDIRAKDKVSAFLIPKYDALIPSV